MNGRLAFAFAAALMLPAFAGCIETPDFLNLSKAEVSALANLGAADKAATEWAKDARLVGVGTLETSEHPDEADMDGDGTSEDEIPQDPDVGNGLARVWWYAYASGEGEAAKVQAWRVAADGTVERQDDQGFAAELGGTAIALGDWTTDSDDAIAVAKTNGTFLNAIAGENATVVHILVHDEDKTLWRVVGVSRAGVAIAVVDANDGSLVDVHTFDMSKFRMPKNGGFTSRESATRPYVEIHESGRVSEDKAFETKFDLPADAEGMLRLRSMTESPTVSVRYQILEENGEVLYYGGAGNRFGRDVEREFDIELEEGRYVLRVFADSMFPTGPVKTGEATFDVSLLLGAPGQGYAG